MASSEVHTFDRLAPRAARQVAMILHAAVTMAAADQARAIEHVGHPTLDPSALALSYLVGKCKVACDGDAIASEMILATDTLRTAVHAEFNAAKYDGTR